MQHKSRIDDTINPNSTMKDEWHYASNNTLLHIQTAPIRIAFVLLQLAHLFNSAVTPTPSIHWPHNIPAMQTM